MSESYLSKRSALVSPFIPYFPWRWSEWGSIQPSNTQKTEAALFIVPRGFRPAGKVERCYGNQARYEDLWNPVGVAQLFWCVWKQVVVDGAETLLLSSFPMWAFLKSSQCLSASVEHILSQYHRLSELAGKLDISQSNLVSIQVWKLGPGALHWEEDLESRLCGFISPNSVFSFFACRTECASHMNYLLFFPIKRVCLVFRGKSLGPDFSWFSNSWV